jgi:hypothetical protein
MVNPRSFGRRGTRSSGHSMGKTETVAQATRVQSTGPSIERPVRLSEKSELPSLARGGALISKVKFADMFNAFDIASLIFNRPLLILAEKLPLICAAIEGKTGISVDEQLRRAAEAKVNALPAKAQLAVRGPAKSQRQSVPYPV